ncbi:hypothetical protein [Gimesia alba]|uniref:hypothetical protein n=1 Tax=Gimesia alba TaxID=2527973 RepID=UPI0018D692CA|nr:hypothetical protein [Gimesia alba]
MSGSYLGDVPAASADPLTLWGAELVPLGLLSVFECRAAGEHIDSPLQEEA